MSPGRARLHRSRRLTRRLEFSEVMKTGGRSRDECFSISAQPNLLLHARLGITVSRRVSKKAVARNRIKRQIRESFRQHQHILTGLSVVVMANPVADTKDNPALRTSLSKHWERVSRTCKKSQPES